MKACQASFWKNRRVVVLGAARSGIAAARFLKGLGNQVSVSDQGLIPQTLQAELDSLGIAWEEGGHSAALLSSAEAMIASPGIPLSAYPFCVAKEQGIPVISEIELAGQFLQVPVIAVTGSNGKTTSVTLIHALLEEAGFRTALGGNIGTPLISFVDQPLDWVVAELSSFQLETTYSFRPRIGILLNLYPNHLDRHESMEHYFALKCRIFQAQQAEDFALSNWDNDWCQEIPETLQKNIQWFSLHPGPDVLAWIQDGQLYRQTEQGPEAVIALRDLPLLGSHNHENYLTLLSVSALLKIPKAAVLSAIQRIQGIPHRVEKIADLQGRVFINDSKATNYLATIKALESLEPPLILLAGGRDKGGDFCPLAQVIQNRVKHVILLGEAASHFAQELHKTEYNQISMATSLQDAVQKAWELSQPGDHILLSPACASYDMFANFEKRGESFKACVASLTP